ncbi:radical SAM protein [Streptomyces scopuliridis]|uniref:Radical SAM protein n=1 Tax=Streptomyces scopuliridis TaxID=452529 RepID=A0ACD4ZY32_9ACTN|nr:cyclophane-forming radical SAM peptide maturase AmcB [Streptomyces scopuliridis]WSB38303.1 radical SAM protein [Streptomyces scopuliridis]WSC02742.1 radical SAM protein [Streptomyces scopuliridis]WSC03725.1 radical SAM protein [Streptomyces scopuliridis]
MAITHSNATVRQVDSGDAGSMQTGRVRLAGSASAVLMQPTTLCNLDCSYCYLPDRKVARRMSVEVAEAVATGVREWSRRHPVTVAWHGGEPLAVGPAYFRSLVEPFGPGESHAVAHKVTTNATRIDDAWCEVFSQVPVQVTVSIDGSGEANASRMDWAGHPSTAQALRGIDTLRRAGIGFNVIAVVSDLSSGAAGRLYRFACEVGCESLAVNVAEKKGVYAGGREPQTGAVAFWQELAASWQADPRIRIRDLDHAYTYIHEELSGAAAQRADRPIKPLPLVTWDGHFLPVGAELAGFRSPHHGPFTAGNVLDTPLAALAARAEQVPWVAEALAGIANCRSQCEYFAYCRSGQVANKYFETGRLDTTETAYCRTSKINLLEGILRHAEHART